MATNRQKKVPAEAQAPVVPAEDPEAISEDPRPVADLYGEPKYYEFKTKVNKRKLPNIESDWLGEYKPFDTDRLQYVTADEHYIWAYSPANECYVAIGKSFVAEV